MSRRPLARVRRIDAAEVIGVRVDATETVDGFRLYTAHFARVGVQDYGTHLEYRPPDEVEASFDFFELRPLTDLHPPSNVDAATARFLARGATSKAQWAADKRHAEGRLAVWDAELITKFDAAAASGRPMQLSAGYTLDLDPTAGTDPDTGERYDAIQRNIQINHVAAVPLGRAGTAQVLDSKDWVGAVDLGHALRLDSVRGRRVIVDLGRWTRADGAILEQQKERKTMKITTNVDGKPVTIELEDKAGPQQIADAVAKLHEDAAKVRADMKPPILPEDEEKAKKAKKDADEALDKIRADLEQGAADRVDALTQAKIVIGHHYDGTGKTPDAIRLDIVGAALGKDARKKIEGLDEAERASVLRYVASTIKPPQREDGARALLAEIQAAAAKRNGDGQAQQQPTPNPHKDAHEQRSLPRAARKRS